MISLAYSLGLVHLLKVDVHQVDAGVRLDRKLSRLYFFPRKFIFTSENMVSFIRKRSGNVKRFCSYFAFILLAP